MAYKIYVGNALFAKVEQKLCAMGNCGNCISCVQAYLRKAQNKQEMHIENA